MTVDINYIKIQSIDKYETSLGATFTPFLSLKLIIRIYFDLHNCDFSAKASINGKIKERKTKSKQIKSENDKLHIKLVVFCNQKSFRKTTNPNPSPTGLRFGFVLFGKDGRL